MAEAAYFAIVLALLTCIYGSVVFILGAKKDNASLLASARASTLAVALLTTFATTIFVYYLMTGNYSIKYVYNYTSNDLSLFYKFTAWWAGNAGSLLLWLFLLVWYTVLASYSKRARSLTPYAGVILLSNSAFFLFTLIFLANPFERLSTWYPGAIYSDGAGLNPMLQNPGMIFHPLTTYLGYVGFAVPFAFAMSALIIRNSDDDWIRVTRRWTILAWMFLSLGNLWGAQWAYAELGWGGYWAWDPVENASLMPWLTSTAFLHSVMIQERKNMLKIWNVSLITITFVLTLFGTFLVRSGVLTSVHSFGNSSLGSFFLLFTLFALFLGIYLIISRRKLLAQGRTFDSFISKESSFLINNLVLVGLAFAVFWGTIYPLISEAVRGIKVTVGAPFFNSVSIPLGLAMFFLMGICPLIAWRKASIKNLISNFLLPATIGLITSLAIFMLGTNQIASLISYGIAAFIISTFILEILRGTRIRHNLTGESYPWALLRLVTRNRRRHGGYIVHLGLVLILIGVTGSHTNALNVTQHLTVGESFEIGDYKITYNFLKEKKTDSQNAVYAGMSLYDSKTEKFIGEIQPQQVFYSDEEQPFAEIGLRSTLKEDLYVILAGWDQEANATFRVFVNPLVTWIWIGGYVLIIGSIFALWPGRGSETGSKFLHQHQRTS